MDTTILFKKRAPKNATIRKRPATPVHSDSSDYSSSADEGGGRIKRRKRKGGISVGSGKVATDLEALQGSKYAADRSTQIDTSNDATKQSNWYDEDKDETNPQRLLGTTRAIQVKPNAESTQSNGTYQGAANYQSFIQKSTNAPSKQVGPIKAPTNIRTITITDMAPDVCKDYKQTGFCGFGDSCKFLHAREDYKAGWQLDREWENVTKGKMVGGRVMSSRNKTGQDGTDSEDESLLEGIPFACIICKESYRNPIVTKCGHYFCEACALKRFKKTPTCAACGAGTGGVFNGAKNLRKLLDKKRERARKAREKAREAGEEIEEEDEDEEDE